MQYNPHNKMSHKHIYCKAQLIPYKDKHNTSHIYYISQKAMHKVIKKRYSKWTKEYTLTVAMRIPTPLTP